MKRTITQDPHDSRIYSDMSGMYDRVFTNVFGPRIHSVIGSMDFPEGARILEVGVGTGLSVDAYPQHTQVTAIDLSEEMLERAAKKMTPERHGHIELKQMDALNLEFEDNSFDYVFGFHIITVVPDPPGLAVEMARVCKPGGEVVIINHFSSDKPVVRTVVDAVDPVTRIFGWSTRLHLDEVLATSGLKLERRYKDAFYSLFTIVHARKPETAAAG